MRKIILSIGAVALIIGVIFGVYVFIQDQEIKKDLVNVEQAQFVENENVETAEFSSEVELTRTNGVWSTQETGQFSVDTNSLVLEFTGYKPGGLHTGSFQNINSVIRLNESGQPVSARIALDVLSVKTDSSALDKHLQTDDFFSTEKYPEIIAEIKQITMNGTSLNAITDISMKGVTRTISIPMQIATIENKTSFKIDTRIKISDFNIAYGPVQDEVRLAVSGTIVKK